MAASGPKKANLAQRLKQFTINTIFPGQDPQAYFQFNNNQNASNLSRNLHDAFDPQSPMLQPGQKSFLGMGNMDFEHRLNQNKALSNAERKNITELHKKISGQSNDEEQLLIKQQLFLITQLNLRTIPKPEDVGRLFEAQTDAERAKQLREIILKDKQEVVINPIIASEEQQDPLDFEATTVTLTDMVDARLVAIDGEPKLDAMAFSPKDQETGPPVIVVHYGNADCYENHIEELQKLAQDNNCTVIGFNIRGFGLSDGKITKSSQEPVDDAKRVLETLTSRGVDSQNPKPIPLNEILLRGESIGAAILTIAADQFSDTLDKKKMQSQGNVGLTDNTLREEPFVFNSRSFSSLDLAAAGFVTRSPFLGKLLSPIANKLLDVFNLNMKPGDAFANLREDRKDYLVVKKDKANPNTQSDDVIATFASIHKHHEIQEKRREQKRSAQAQGDHEQLQDIKSQHKAVANSYGHSRSLEGIASKKDSSHTGLHMFQSFIEKAKKNIETKQSPPDEKLSEEKKSRNRLG